MKTFSTLHIIKIAVRIPKDNVWTIGEIRNLEYQKNIALLIFLFMGFFLE